MRTKSFTMARVGRLMYQVPAVFLITAALVSVDASAAVTPSEHFSITSKEVVQAMESKQLPVDGVEVVLPAHISTTVAEPALDVASVAVVDSHNARLRMECQVRSVCTPFYAAVHWSSAKTLSPQQIMSAHGAAIVAKAAAGQVMLRSGSTAMMLIDEDRLHIRMPVVCMQGGAVGDKVRVTTPNHRQTFEALILNAQELKGSL